MSIFAGAPERFSYLPGRLPLLPALRAGAQIGVAARPVSVRATSAPHSRRQR
jgi:hypothetical protein